MVIGTLAIDGWAVTLGTARRGLGGLDKKFSPLGSHTILVIAPRSPILAVPNVTAHPSMAVYQLHIT